MTQGTHLMSVMGLRSDGQAYANHTDTSNTRINVPRV